MNNSLGCFSLSIALLAGTPSWADPGIDCDHPRGTPETQYCAEQSFLHADRELNRVYRELTARLSVGERSALTKAQRAWITFRDAHCAFDTGKIQGASLGEVIHLCQETLTEQRTAYLRRVWFEKNYLGGPPTAEVSSDGYEPPAWYAIMASFPNTPKGGEQAHQLLAQIHPVLGDASVFVSESGFYQGLTPDLLVILKGPFEDQKAANEWLRHPQIQKHLPDAYAKQARARILDH